MALDGVLQSGLSAILTNSAAMRVTSDNIANVHTPGYARRVALQETLTPGGILAGVQLGAVTRIVNEYLDKEVLNASGTAARYDVQSSLMNQLNAALGQPGDGNSIGSQIDALYATLGRASLEPNSLATRLGALSQFESLAQAISGLAGSIADLRAAADQEVSTIVAQSNTLIRQIAELNPQIQHAFVMGDTASGLLDQRDLLVQQLSELTGVRTIAQPNGRLFVSTADGVQLVGDNYAQLTYQPSAGPSYKPITVQTVNALTGQPIGPSQTFDPHATSGRMRGLLDTRDGILAAVGAELGALAQSLSLDFNAAHNAHAAVPPPTSMTGRETGLLSTDSLGFTGATTIGITDSSGALLHRIAIDFAAGTLSLDGGAPSALGATVGSFVTALDTALGANGDAGFANGVLTLSATGSNGIVIADEAGNASSRGGIGFSHFFGLNDLFQTTGNAILTTGLQSGDTAGFIPGGAISLLLKGPQGQRIGETSVAVSGTTIGDMVAALNTAFTGKATFALDANGALQVTQAAAYSGYELEVTLDTTQRGSTGASFSSLFGVGIGEKMARAQGFSVGSQLPLSPQLLAFAAPALTSVTPLSTMIVTPGDNRGILALQDLINQRHAIGAAGALPSRIVTFTDYAAAFYQDIASRGSAIDRSKSAEDTRLRVAKQTQSEKEGVNLDEELTKMMVLQQAYNAGARLIQVSQELYDELLRAVGV